MAPFQVKTTEAMHYRRVAIRAMEAEGRTADAIARTSVGRGFGIRDGNGIMFVNHDGAVYPSGFLPIPSATCARRASSSCTGRQPGLQSASATRHGSRVGAVAASTAGSVAARGPGRSRGRATRSRPIRSARTCRRRPERRTHDGRPRRRRRDQRARRRARARPGRRPDAARRGVRPARREDRDRTGRRVPRSSTGRTRS